MSDWKPDEGMMLEVRRDPDKGPTITMHVSDSYRAQCQNTLLEAHNYIAPFIRLQPRQFLDSDDLDRRSAILDEINAVTVERLARDIGDRAKYLKMEIDGHWITTGFESDDYTIQFLRDRGVRLDTPTYTL